MKKHIITSLHKKKKTLQTIIPNHLWFFDTKWENENTFSKIKEKRKKKKNKEHIKKREKVGNKREGWKIKERKRKIKQGKKSCLSNKLL